MYGHGRMVSGEESCLQQAKLSAKNAHLAVQLAVLVARSALQQELHQLQILTPDVIIPLSPVHCFAGE